MCAICEGATMEEVRAGLYQQTLTRGFAIVPVGGGWDHFGWAYTIGLVDARDQPELVVAGIRLRHAVAAVGELGAQVLQGTRFAPGRSAELFNGTIGFGEVHPNHLRWGLMNSWYDYYWAALRNDLELRVLQAIVPYGNRCYEHEDTQPRLDDHRHQRFDGRNGLNRAARRAHPHHTK